MKKRLLIPALMLSALLLGMICGWLLGRASPGKALFPAGSFTETRAKGFRFVNPLLECDVAESILMQTELRTFKYKIQELVNRLMGEKKAGMVSVYFRDLSNGPWYGINEREVFYPASLMKLPLLIGYLKKAEADPTLFLSRVLVNDNVEDLNQMQNFKPSETIAPGKGYTVEDLLYRMMAYSDNNAWSLLLRNFHTTDLDRILQDLNVAYLPGESEDRMTVRSYATFLRILYNASYLNKEMSEKALELMAVIDFPGGIRAGVPADIPVAGKYGERLLQSEGGGLVQLHEFAIVYHPRRPFLVGIMTRGQDFASLTEVIREVAQRIYREVDLQ